MEATWNGALFSAATIRLPVSTQTGHPDFPQAAAQARRPSASFAAWKQPFVISHTRPSADAGRTFRNRPFDAAPMAFAQG